MRVAVFALFAGCVAVGSAPRVEPDITCRVELLRASETEVSVQFTIDAHGDYDGETTFTSDDSWGGTQNSTAVLTEVQFEERGGAKLAVEHPEPARWTVHHAPGAPLRVTYAILANAFEDDTNPSVHYKPIVNAHLVHFIGTLAFILPQHGEDDAAQRFHFEWVGFENAGWKTATSFSTDVQFDVAIEPSNFRQAVFLAAPDLALHRREIRGREIVVAFAGSWDQRETPFVDAAARIVDVERAFFDDDEYPYYLIACIPVGRNSEHGSSLGGTGLTNSFALFVQAGTNMDPASDKGAQLLHVLAHEMFHNWNGRIIGRANPEELVYWFSEGFTDFYARRILYSAGLKNTSEYVKELNARLAEYWASPARNATAETIRERFWKDRSVEQLPYERGDVLALLVDAEIRRHGDARGLDGLMRDLVKRGRTGEKTSNNALIAEIAARTSPEFGERVRRVAVDGEMPELPADLLEPALTLSIDSIPTWDPGFDLDALQKEHAIRGVHEGSNAWKAGLRDGQKLRTCSINHGDTAHAIEIGIADESGPRKIEWMPLGDPIATPQVHAKAATPEHGAEPL